MGIEYEATFLNTDKDEIRQRLESAGAELIKPEFLQKRFVFNLPGKQGTASWLRVRDEADKITMSLKSIEGNKIEDQKEINLTIDNFERGIEFLQAIGCQRKSYQETKRELWKLDGVDVCLDEWPFLEPFVEIEGQSEEEVKAVSRKLDFDYSKALFCAVGLIYSQKYNLPVEVIDNETPKIVFDMKNPFLGFKK
jgi:adenylate cyclase class 2